MVTFGQMQLHFEQSPTFSKHSDSLLSDDQMIQLENELMKNPKIGDVIPGSKGIRKMRFAIKGRGKRGGSRVIYVYRMVNDLIQLIDIYSKNKKGDLTKDELKKRIKEANE